MNDETPDWAHSFGSVADRYQRGRAGYTAATIEWLLGPEPLDVLDLVGKFGEDRFLHLCVVFDRIV